MTTCDLTSGDAIDILPGPDGGLLVAIQTSDNTHACASLTGTEAVLAARTLAARAGEIMTPTEIAQTMDEVLTGMVQALYAAAANDQEDDGS